MPLAYKEISTNLLLLLKLSGLLLSGLLLGLALLQESLGDKDLVVGRDASVHGQSCVQHTIVWKRAPSGNCSYSGILAVANSKV